MFFTARQLETLHRESGANGQLVLPYRARLTPAAQDWLRSKKVTLGYSDDPFRGSAGAPQMQDTPFRGRSQNADSGAGVGSGNGAGTGANRTGDVLSPAKRGEYAGSSAGGALLWWCDGPCGAAKAAITAQERESSLRAVELPADAKQIVPAIKAIAREIKAGSATAAVLLVSNASLATVFANRCPSLRAVVGTCLEALEQGIQQMAANVLVIEHPYKTLPQVKSLLSRFARAKRDLSPDVQRQLAELASCG
jgi:hypothetical protein